jgi:hypothetical protein
VFVFISGVVARPAAFTRRRNAQLCGGGHGLVDKGKLLGGRSGASVCIPVGYPPRAGRRLVIWRCCDILFWVVVVVVIVAVVVVDHNVDLFCSGKHGDVGGDGGGVRHLRGRERFQVVVVAVVLRAVELAFTIQEIFALVFGGVFQMKEGFVPQDTGIRVGGRRARASLVISVAAISTPRLGVFATQVGSRCVPALVGCSERPWCYSSHLRICNQPVHLIGTVVGQHRRRGHLRICNQPVYFIGTVVRQHRRCCHLCR